jgi:hypothetical protein
LHVIRNIKVIKKSIHDAPLHSLKNSNVNPKVKTTKEEGIGVRSLTPSTLRVKGHVGASGWGLGQMIKKSNYSHKPAQPKQ